MAVGRVIEHTLLGAGTLFRVEGLELVCIDYLALVALLSHLFDLRLYCK